MAGNKDAAAAAALAAAEGVPAAAGRLADMMRDMPGTSRHCWSQWRLQGHPLVDAWLVAAGGPPAAAAQLRPLVEAGSQHLQRHGDSVSL
jgi:hypothetical protein